MSAPYRQQTPYQNPLEVNPFPNQEIPPVPDVRGSEAFIRYVLGGGIPGGTSIPPTLLPPSPNIGFLGGNGQQPFNPLSPPPPIGAGSQFHGLPSIPTAEAQRRFKDEGQRLEDQTRNPNLPPVTIPTDLRFQKTAGTAMAERPDNAFWLTKLSNTDQDALLRSPEKAADLVIRNYGSLKGVDPTALAEFRSTLGDEGREFITNFQEETGRRPTAIEMGRFANAYFLAMIAPRTETEAQSG